ncbi:MAG TPA: hypothetical protein VE961_10775 [Pyrinomonadaceae bacterium]|nr:hypothetical protein [Pyrinomonadaceae bacterium]
MPELDESWLIPDTDANPPLKKFAPDELLTCSACLRANAPTRVQCMYCGAALAETQSPEAEPATTPAEAQASHYVVVRQSPNNAPDESVLRELAVRFQFKPEELRSALVTGEPVPLRAIFSEAAAGQMLAQLGPLNSECAVIAATDLEMSEPRVIRALGFGEDGVTAISKHGKEQLSASWNDLALIVTGRLLIHRVEIDERRSRGTVKALDRRELTQDQSVIDIYARSFDLPWRIMVNDFDFSSLADRKTLTAYENSRELLEVLINRSHAKLNDSYAHVRPALANIWPLASSERQGRSQRPRANRRDVSIVTASDNEAQFNHYSRLAWCWERRHLPGDSPDQAAPGTHS